MMHVMSVRDQQKKESHTRIVQAAARAVREKGFDRVSVAEVMRAAGLTHGGFYAHFASKDELLAAAVEHAGEQSAQLLQVLAGGPSGQPPDLNALVDTYLSSMHLNTAGFGCPMAALGADTARQATPVRQAMAHRVGQLADAVTKATCVGKGPHQGPPVSPLATVALLVGAMTLARAVDDPAQAEAILDAARSWLMARSD